MFPLVLVYLFLIRLRFPQNSSVAYVLRRRYGEPVLNQYRALERIDYKVKKIECDIDFLSSCQQQDLIPNFLQFKLHLFMFKDQLYKNW